MPRPGETPNAISNLSQIRNGGRSFFENFQKYYLRAHVEKKQHVALINQIQGARKGEQTAA